LESDPDFERFMPRPDVRERFEITVRAPAALVMAEARDFDLQSLRVVHAIFGLREWLMGASPAAPRASRRLFEEMRSLGWGVLVEEPDRLLICGAACQPWLADVRFRAIAPERFADYAEPDQVKIAWTLEAIPLGPQRTRFAQETRVVATDDAARAKFRRYWGWARFGIIGIRLLLLPALRRAAERRWAAQRARTTQDGP